MVLCKHDYKMFIKIIGEKIMPISSDGNTIRALETLRVIPNDSGIIESTANALVQLGEEGLQMKVKGRTPLGQDIVTLTTENGHELVDKKDKSFNIRGIGDTVLAAFQDLLKTTGGRTLVNSKTQKEYGIFQPTFLDN
jgi:hypothetical protein